MPNKKKQENLESSVDSFDPKVPNELNESSKLEAETQKTVVEAFIQSQSEESPLNENQAPTVYNELSNADETITEEEELTTIPAEGDEETVKNSAEVTEIMAELEKDVEEFDKAPIEKPLRTNFRIYDEIERSPSKEAWQEIYDAANPVHKGFLKGSAVGITEYDGQKCLVLYLPDVNTGVRALLPESMAGLLKKESLEGLMRYPYLRVTPVKINREEEYCVVNRKLAQEIAARRIWNNVSEGSDIEGHVISVLRAANRNSDDTFKKPVKVVLDIGGIVSEMPISEVSHNFVYDVDYKKGDKISVRIVKKIEKVKEKDGKFNVVRSFIASKRAQVFNPWTNEEFIPKIGSPYSGVIIHVSERFLHIRLHNDIEVLCHRPSLNYKGRENLAEGTNVVIYITRIDRERRLAQGNLSRKEADKEIRFFKYLSKKKHA